MSFVGAALALYAAQWVALPLVTDEWTFLLGASCLTTALLVTGVSLLCRESTVLVRSVLVLWALNTWADVAKFAAWNYTDTRLDLSVPLALLFAIWLLFVVRRRYDMPSDRISTNNVTLLIKRPSGWLDFVKGLFGAPVSSVCVCVGQTVWAYRRRSGEFEMFTLAPSIVRDHIAVDTGVGSTPEILAALNSLVGAKRGPLPYKCLWTIRNVLDMIGGKYVVKSWLDYVPGLYAMRVL